MQGLAQKTDERSAFLFAHNIVRPQQAVRLADDGSDGDGDGDGDGAGTGNAANGRHVVGGGGHHARGNGNGGGDPHPHNNQNNPANGGRVIVEEVWNSDKMRRVLVKHSTRLLGSKINISNWRHFATAIARKHLNNAFKGSGIDEDSYEDDDDDENEEDWGGLAIWDEQAGHTAWVSGMIYGRLAAEGLAGIEIKQLQFRNISMRWHRFLGITSTGDGPVRYKRWHGDSYEGEAQAQQAKARRFARTNQADLVGMLRQMLDKNDAAFRGNQEAAIRGIVRGESPVIQIASTGGGKSLSFMLPAYCTPDGVTVVVVPLTALESDLERRCREARIPAAIWSSREPVQMASIVLVTPESVITKGFRGFINRLLARQRLDRVVIDECHVILDSSADFRPKLLELGRTIADWGVQLVMLTATLAPRDEGEFFHKMCIDRTRVCFYSFIFYLYFPGLFSGKGEEEEEEELVG
jgi:hypothetical protein